MILLALFILISLPLVLSQEKVPCTKDSDCLERGLTNHFCNTTTGFCEPRQDVQTTPGNYIVVPSTTPEPTSAQSPYIPSEYACQDSDGGEDIFTKGVTVTITDSLTDQCIDKKTVNEAVCKGIGTEYKKINCPEKHRCEGGRCLEIKGNVTFEVDEQIFRERSAENPYGRGLDRELNYQSYFVDRTVAEYDPLVCEFEAKETIDPKEINFRVFDSFEKTEIVSKPPSRSVSCGENKCTMKIEPETFKRGINLSANIPPEVNKITCEVTFKGEKFTSKPLNIANHLYIFVHIAPPFVENAKDQYNYFLARTQLDSTSAKPIYRKPGECNGDSYMEQKLAKKKELFERVQLLLNDAYTPRDEKVRLGIKKQELKNQIAEIENALYNDLGIEDSFIFSDSVEALLFSQLCSNSLKELHNSKHDRIIGLTANSLRILYDSGGFTVHSFPNRNVVVAGSFLEVVAHELGHTYDLCDEYSQEKFNSPNDVYSCRNKYPRCCLDSDENDDLRFTLGKTKCEDIGGFCHNGTTCTDVDAYMKDRFGLGCLDRKSEGQEIRCCITQSDIVRAGNNCFSSFKVVPVTETESGIDIEKTCAGMPINRDGTEAIVNGKPDIESQYVSIMGPISIGYIVIKGYPVTNDLPYPLKPGLLGIL